MVDKCDEVEGRTEDTSVRGRHQRLQHRVDHCFEVVGEPLVVVVDLLVEHDGVVEGVLLEQSVLELRVEDHTDVDEEHIAYVPPKNGKEDAEHIPQRETEDETPPPPGSGPEGPG